MWVTVGLMPALTAAVVLGSNLLMHTLGKYSVGGNEHDGRGAGRPRRSLWTPTGSRLSLESFLEGSVDESASRIIGPGAQPSLH